MERVNQVYEPCLSSSCFQQPGEIRPNGLGRSPPNSLVAKSERMATIVKQLHSVERICEVMMKQIHEHKAKEAIAANEDKGSFTNITPIDSPLYSQSGSEKEKMDTREHAPVVDVIDLTSEDSCGEDADMDAEQAGATQPVSEAIVSEPSPSGRKNAPGKFAEGEVMVISDDDEEDLKAPKDDKLELRAPQGNEEDFRAPQDNEEDLRAPLRAVGLKWIGESPMAPGGDPYSTFWSYMEEEKRIRDQGIDPTSQNTSDAHNHFIRKDGTEGDPYTSVDGICYPSIHWADRETVVIPLVTPTEPRGKRARGRPRKDSTPDFRKDEGLQNLANRDGASDAPTEPPVNIGGKRKGHYQGHDESVPGKVERQKVNSGRKECKLPRKEGRKSGRTTKNKDGTDDEDDEDEEELDQHPKAEEKDPVKEFLSRLKEDEQVPYFAHRKNATDGRGEDYDSDAELGSLFRDMDLAESRFQEVSRVEAKESRCEHKYVDLDEVTGDWYCEDCGCCTLEKPSIPGQKQINEACQHPNIYFDDETGYYCYTCGKTRDIEKMLLISDELKRARKHMNKGQQYDTAAEEEVRQFQLRLRAGSNDLDFTEETLHLHPSLEQKLHSHQKDGFKFLTENLLGGGDSKNDSLGCVIAHAPGTGKTCLIITFIQSYLAMFEKGRPLILAPKIMLHAWKKEFDIWKIQNVTIHEIATDSTLRRDRDTALGDARSDDEEEEEFKISNQAKLSRKHSRAKTLQKWQADRSVLLMNYQLYMYLVGNGLKEDVHPDSLDAQISQILRCVPNLVIMDEGHLARNMKTNISDALLAMETKRRVLLSGTLFQNNFRELFSLLKLCRSNFMIDHPAFLERMVEQAGGIASLKRKSREELTSIEFKIFSEEIGDRLESYVKSGTIDPDEVVEIVTKLQSLTAPFVDWYPGEILRSLPGLEEYAVYLKLTKAQLRTLDHLFSLGNDYRNNHMFKQKKLQSACVHPSLAQTNDGDILEHPSESSDPYDGVKVTFILELIALCQLRKEKILIFCTTLAPFRYFEKVLSDKFKWEREREILRIDGKMQESERQGVIRRFNEAECHRLLLASTKACKEGISLVGASRVVILDNPDNPSVVRQAVSRAFRIGQTKKVYVYRLVAHNKDEEETFLKSVNKERLSQVLSDPRNSLPTKEQFLRKVTEKTVEDELLEQMMLGHQKHIFHSVHRYNASG